MGSEESKPGFKAQSCSKIIVQIVQDEYFVVHPLQKMGLAPQDNKKYIWVDPKIYNSQNQKYLAMLKEQFSYIESSTSVQGATQNMEEGGIGEKFQLICAASLPDQEYSGLQNDPRVERIILFCNKKQRGSLLQSNFSKIESTQFNFQDLKKAIQQNNKHKSEQVQGITALFMIEEDTNVLNKYRLNYACLCQNNSQEKSKEDFANLARKIFPDEQKNIVDFQKNYQLNLSQSLSNDQALNWATRKSFYWDLISQLPRLTTDPKRLAYLRLPFRNLYRAIRHNYNSMQKKPAKLFLVTTLTKTEQEKLVENKQNFFSFATFMRGFTNKKDAIKARKANKDSLIFEIILNKEEKDKQLDFGYAVIGEEGENVIFNIYNFFTINQTQEIQSRNVVITYGSLAEASAKRKSVKKMRIRPTLYQNDLLRNYDYIEDLTKRVNSQATVLQMSGYFKQSIEVYQKKSDFLGKIHASQQVMDMYYLQVGGAYRLNQQYKKALEEYSKISTENMKLVAQVHIAELYHQSKDNIKFNSTVNALQSKISELLLYNPPQAFKTMNYVAISLMNEGKYKEANKKFNDIIPEMTKYYDYKYEGISLAHDMLRNKATCQSKMKNFSEALNLLTSTKGWQKVCQGITPNYALTQNLIQQVHISRGDAFRARQSQTEVDTIRRSLAAQDQDYMNRSRVVVNLNESMIKIDL